MNMKEERDEAIAEFYLRLLPYILKDFIHKDDLREALEKGETSLLDVQFYATQRLIAMKERFDNGEPASSIVKPLINID